MPRALLACAFAMTLPGADGVRDQDLVGLWRAQQAGGNFDIRFEPEGRCALIARDGRSAMPYRYRIDDRGALSCFGGEALPPGGPIEIRDQGRVLVINPGERIERPFRRSQE